MVSIKLFKPYYIKICDERIRLILAYKYFTVIIDNEEYQFVPLKGKEIEINLRTKDILNTDTVFAFKNDKEVKYVSMKKLAHIRDFTNRLREAIKPYYEEYLEGEDIKREKEKKVKEKSDKIIAELERKNLLRLIDHALDKKDKEAFEKLIKMLK